MQIPSKVYKILNITLGAALLFLMITGGALSLKNRLSFPEIRIISDVNSGTFKNPILASANIPQGAKFLASRSGKTFYPLLDSRGSRIAEKNRIYFWNEEQALSMGYKRPK
jgi:hypothetical protein